MAKAQINFLQEWIAIAESEQVALQAQIWDNENNPTLAEMTALLRSWVDDLDRGKEEYQWMLEQLSPTSVSPHTAPIASHAEPGVAALESPSVPSADEDHMVLLSSSIPPTGKFNQLQLEDDFPNKNLWYKKGACCPLCRPFTTTNST